MRPEALHPFLELGCPRSRFLTVKNKKMKSKINFLFFCKKIGIKSLVRPRTPYLESFAAGVVRGGDRFAHVDQMVLKFGLNRVQKIFG